MRSYNPKDTLKSGLANGQSLKLGIRGITVPSFKNRKRAIMNNKTGKLRTLTEPKIKERMNALTRAIVSALFSEYQTTVVATLTECSLRSWIQSNLPEDDCWQCIPEIRASVIRVPKGEEGADILIERLK